MHPEGARVTTMGVAKVIEVVGSSPESLDDAVKQAVAEAARTIRNIHGVDVRNFTVKVRDDQILEYRVDCKIAFGLESEGRHVRPEMEGRTTEEVARSVARH
jgi:dodecin